MTLSSVWNAHVHLGRFRAVQEKTSRSYRSYRSAGSSNYILGDPNDQFTDRAAMAHFEPVEYTVGSTVFLASLGAALYLEPRQGMMQRLMGRRTRIYIGTVSQQKPEYGSNKEADLPPNWIAFRRTRLGLTDDQTFVLIKPDATSISEKELVGMLDELVEIQGHKVKVGDSITAFNLYKWYRTVDGQNAKAIIKQVVQPGPTTPGGAVLTYTLTKGGRETRFVPLSMFSNEEPPVYRTLGGDAGGEFIDPGEVFPDPGEVSASNVAQLNVPHPLLGNSLATTVEYDIS